MIKKIISGVANAAGGKDLVDYASTKIAQRRNPELKQYIPQTTSFGQAAKSAGKVGMNALSMVGAGTVGKALSTALRARTVKKAIKPIKQGAKSFRIPEQRGKIKLNQSNRKPEEIQPPKTFSEGGW